MTLPELADQEARDDAEQQLDRTLFVEAGAGTGKTTMLVGRVVALITTGTAHMDQIAAITFTEAAAAELRDQLAVEFEKLATVGNQRARDALDALNGAAVTTLHGFARRILAEQPFAVGLPPLFEITDQSSALVSFDERWHRFITSMLENPAHEELMVRALSCGLDTDTLRAVAMACDQNWDRLVERPPIGAAPALDATRLIGFLQESLQCASHCSDADDLLLQFLIGHIGDSLHAVQSSTGEIDLLQILFGSKKFESTKGKKGNWCGPDGRDHKGEVLTLLGAAEAERGRLIDDTAQWVLSSVFAHIVSFTLRAVDERRLAGRLTFLDLLVLARNLVSEHPEARADLHRRYCHILIDEFQDTDPIQAELAMYLATDSVPAGTPDWSSFLVPPGRLFFVGDPKQSIYRFRRADIELFMRVRNHVVIEPLQLQVNFRSRPQIVEWVNAVFGSLFGAGEPGKQPAYRPLIAFDDKGSDNPRGLKPVVVLGHEPIDGLSDEIREQQARDVVAAIATMHQEGWKLGPSASPMTYADVAILVRTRTGLPILESAFQAAGIPCRLESSSLVYASHEVQEMLAVLRAIDDPSDALHVLAALRSPAFGCGDDDLFLHRGNGGDWDPRHGVADGTPVGEALARMHSFHLDSRWQSVSELVSAVVEDLQLMSLALGESRARESWRRIRFLMDQARLFDEVNGGDLRAFLRWVGHQEEDDAKVTEAILPESDDDAVRITTIHASKGLEYPVVVLLGLQTVSQTTKDPLLFTPLGPELHLKPLLETPGYQAAYEYEKEMEAYERYRLLYVAATRARDVLVVSAHRGDAAGKSLATQIVEQCDACPDLWSDGSDLCTDDGRVAPVPEPPVTPEVDDAGRRALFVEQRSALLEKEQQPRTIAATGVQHLANEGEAPASPGETWPAEVESGEHAGDPSVHRRGRAGTSVGRAVHAVLQVIDLETGEGLEALSRAQAVAEGVPGRFDEVRNLVQSALASELVRRAVDSGRYWREVYVGVPVGERVLEGFIDLLFETPDGLHVVDYKTDRLPAGQGGAAIADRYRFQGASYALAARLALGKPIADCSFLVLGASEALAAPLSDLHAAMEQVEQLLSHRGS